jgi:hypothetical protein
VSTNLPIEPGRHGWADLLRLVDAVRHIAYDHTLDPGDALRRIRDAFHDYDTTWASNDGGTIRDRRADCQRDGISIALIDDTRRPDETPEPRRARSR